MTEKQRREIAYCARASSALQRYLDPVTGEQRFACMFTGGVYRIRNGFLVPVATGQERRSYKDERKAA